MLEGLDLVDWNKLVHAYGPAIDVPEQIRNLASHSSDVREKALWQLYGNIFHQGTRYPATAVAVPFLFELLERPDVPDRHKIVYLLVGLALGFEEEMLPKGVDLGELLPVVAEADHAPNPQSLSEIEIRRQFDLYERYAVWSVRLS
jgi:hypothetical protein